MPNFIKDRKAFNFYRSYWEIGCELPNEDRLKFYDAIFNKQFNNEETELSGLSKLAYISQRFSIEQQVNGYVNNGLRQTIVIPSVGASVGASMGASMQEKEKEKEKEKKKKETSVEVLEKRKRVEVYLLKYFSKDYVNEKTIDTIISLEKKYTSLEIDQAIRFGTSDDFWKAQFLSPNKLKTKNKEGVFFIDLFLAKSKPVQLKPKSNVIRPIDYLIPKDDYFGYDNAVLIQRCVDGCYKKKDV